ncbi:hypothetical protein H5410_015741 [Solanum commersonii]|uniref:Response regulatory domain-containing protein n=1 Tax=Solanum commersonii TaxID=4109 RepID=A0A9J5ZUC1_SOLCO|nr:hypothetical protein H5410_015741 [Solanum commersonii]
MSSFQSSSSLNNTNIEKQFTPLIVDHDIVVRMVHKALLRKFGVETQEAKNGQEAVLVHHNGACFDLIMMDFDILIMGMTSREKEEEEKSFVDAGFDYYYQKLLTIDVVRDLV